DKNPYSLGFRYADEFSVVDIVNKETCLEYARSKNIDGVLTVATDYGVLSAAHIAREMNLPGLNYDVARVIKNKYLVRRTLFENNVNDISQYFEINNIDYLREITPIIKFPVMVKPCDGSGSKATRRVNSIKELEVACNTAIKASITKKALIEDFVEGKEYGVESFVYDGKVHVLGVIGKFMTPPPDYAELGHYIPSNLDIEEDIKKVVVHAIKSLGINFGSVNMDILVTKANRIYIVDVGARMGGNLIGSHIIPIGTGVDYMDNIIRASVGEMVNLTPKLTGTNIVTKILALKPGKIRELPDFEKIKNEYQVNIYNHLIKGNKIGKYHNNLDGCGYIVTTSSYMIKAVKLAEEVKEHIDREIIREN